MDILDKAIVFATKAHSGSFRKGTTTPYIVHPMEASAIVATMTDDKIILAAAVLHDVVEDTDYTIDDIVKIKEIIYHQKLLGKSVNKRP